jgi:hypothetical protein
VPLDIGFNALAFLVSHVTLEGRLNDAKMEVALEFVHRNERKWRRSEFYELPQWQLHEYYSPCSSSMSLLKLARRKNELQREIIRRTYHRV